MIEEFRTIKLPITGKEVLVRNWITAKERAEINKKIAEGIEIDPITRQPKAGGDILVEKDIELKKEVLNKYVVKIDGKEVNNAGEILFDELPDKDFEFLFEACENADLDEKKKEQ